jgi:hypothetical protein
MGSGNRRQLIYVAEVDQGTTPDTPECSVLRNNGGNGIRLARDSLQSQEMRSDRQVADLVLGNKKPSIDIPFELSYESQEAFLEAALFGDFAVAYNLTAQTVSVNSSAKTFARGSGSWITDGVKVGDRITTTGFEASGNNGTFVVSEVAALTITCSTATGLENVSDDTGVAVTTDRQVLKQGTTEKYFSIEEGFLDVDLYQVLTGAMVNTFALTVANNAIITGSFGMIGVGASTLTDSSIDASPTAAPTTVPFNSYTGLIKENDTESAIVTGIRLNLANGLEQLFALFSEDSHKTGIGRANLTGSISAFFEDETLANKFINGIESSIEFELEDAAGNVYRFIAPRIKYTGADRSLSENNVGIDLPFQAMYDSTTDTAFIIEKIPAAA